MKKVLTILAIMFILLSISVISNAALELTEDKLDKLLNEVCGYKKEVTATSEDGKQTSSITVDFKGVTHKVDTNQDTITLKMEIEEMINGEIVIDYDLSDANKPKFTYNLLYKENMTLEEFENELGKGILAQQVLFAIVGNNEGILPEDTYAYLIDDEAFYSLFSKLINIEILYSKGISSAKLIYDGGASDISNDYMNLIYIKESETSDEYKLKATLEIKEDADFSKLEGYAVKSLKEGFVDNSTNKDENIPLNQISNSLENTNNNQEKNVVANIQKIPQTGNEISLQNILYSVIVIATLIGISLAVYNKKTSK